MKGSRNVRFGVAALAVAASAAGFAVQPASADTGTAVLEGKGNLSAGLGLSGPPQTFSLGVEGVVATTTVQDAVGCQLAGNDTIGSVTSGSGSFTGNCTTLLLGTTNVNGNYTRTGALVTVSGSATATNAGGFSGSFNGACAFTPLVTTTDNPISATVDQFSVACTFTIS